MTASFIADDDAAAYAARVRSQVGRLGGGFFLSSQAKQAGRDLGLRGWPTYFVGRCGVLGDVDADVVAAVCGFFPVEFVRKVWDEGRNIDLTLATEVYLLACQDWGRQHLAAFPGIDRLTELVEAVVLQASPIGAPLFAGWRALRFVDDPHGKCAQLLTTLRELRGAMHLSAVMAVGLTPREAILAGPGGVSNASFFGWTDLDLDADRAAWARDARAEAERLTDRMVASSWGVLPLAERFELATLLDEALAVAFAKTR